MLGLAVAFGLAARFGAAVRPAPAFGFARAAPRFDFAGATLFFDLGFALAAAFLGLLAVDPRRFEVADFFAVLDLRCAVLAIRSLAAGDYTRGTRKQQGQADPGCGARDKGRDSLTRVTPPDFRVSAVDLAAPPPVNLRRLVAAERQDHRREVAARNPARQRDIWRSLGRPAPGRRAQESPQAGAQRRTRRLPARRRAALYAASFRHGRRPGPRCAPSGGGVSGCARTPRRRGARARFESQHEETDVEAGQHVPFETSLRAPAQTGVQVSATPTPSSSRGSQGLFFAGIGLAVLGVLVAGAGLASWFVSDSEYNQLAAQCHQGMCGTPAQLSQVSQGQLLETLGIAGNDRRRRGRLGGARGGGRRAAARRQDARFGAWSGHRSSILIFPAAP